MSFLGVCKFGEGVILQILQKNTFFIPHYMFMPFCLCSGVWSQTGFLDGTNKMSVYIDKEFVFLPLKTNNILEHKVFVYK